MDYIIQTFKLTKKFIPAQSLCHFITHPFQNKKSNLAINNITLQIKQGELFSIIGPNGAGKTTLIKILCCLILPTGGSANVCGYNILREEEKIKASIGLVSSGERGFYYPLTLRQNLHFYAALYNLSLTEAKRKIKKLAFFLEISSELDKRFQEVSSGIKQRLSVARGLLNDPQVLFIDEPTKSLDPAGARDLMNFIKEQLVKEQRKTVVFITHNLSEAKIFSDRIAIMSQGEIKACGTLSELQDKISSFQKNLEDIYNIN